jgi:hypothetical protein
MSLMSLMHPACHYVFSILSRSFDLTIVPSKVYKIKTTS